MTTDGHFPTVAEVRDAHYHKAIEQAGGSIARAAKLLGIGRASLYRWAATAELVKHE